MLSYLSNTSSMENASSSLITSPVAGSTSLGKLRTFGQTDSWKKIEIGSSERLTLESSLFYLNGQRWVLIYDITTLLYRSFNEKNLLRVYAATCRMCPIYGRSGISKQCAWLIWDTCCTFCSWNRGIRDELVRIAYFESFSFKLCSSCSVN